MSANDPTCTPTALVLSGGGVRGAYEVGVIRGIVEVLGPNRRCDPFQVFAGTSVGAINTTFVAAHAHTPDLGSRRLIELWTSLEIDTYLRVLAGDLLSAKPLRTRLRRLIRGPEPRPVHLGRSLLDPRPLEQLVSSGLPWDQLHRNLAQGRIRALIVSALRVATGTTTVFAELAPNFELLPTQDPQRIDRREPITDAHVLASAAIPFLFPARRVGDYYYADGGLRFNTPVTPAVRAGARRVVVVGVHQPPKAAEQRPPLTDEELEAYPDPFFLAGKVLNALLLDPVVNDLKFVDAQNQVLQVLEEELSPGDYGRVIARLEAVRRQPHRKLETLVFLPSQDIGRLAAEHASRLGGITRLHRWILGLNPILAAAHGEADWASYLLFDGEFAGRLIDLGRHDALARAAEIKAFFGE
ncbi:MAG: patatin-like phospholipase family protein [Planctomycetota bacterium]